MGFIRRHAGFCGTEKLKLLSMVISKPVRLVCVQNTSSSDVLWRPTWEAWATQLECLGVRSAPRNFYSDDQLWGLAPLTKILGSPKGSLKFSLEHSLGLEFTSFSVFCVLQSCQFFFSTYWRDQAKLTTRERLENLRVFIANNITA